MTVYPESSALLRWLLLGPGGDQVRDLLASARHVFTSRLTLIEVERALVRHTVAGRMSVAESLESRRILTAALSTWRVMEMSGFVCERAAEAFPIEPVRTLDAIHLATVLLVARFDPALTVLTTDRRVIENVTRLGLRHLPA